MGIFKMFSNSKSPPPMPNPVNFFCTKTKVVGKLVVAMVTYPDCPSFKGNKVLVYETSKATFKQRKKLDPHFLENGFSPIARFPGTKEGFDDGVLFAVSKVKKKRSH